MLFIKRLSLFMIVFSTFFAAFDFYHKQYFWGIIQVICLFLNARNYRSIVKTLAETETYERGSFFK